MKKKILIGVLAIFCAALIFETGYLIGLNSKIKIRRGWYSQRRPVVPMRNLSIPEWEDSRDIAFLQRSLERGQPIRPPIQKSGYFFVTAMTSKDIGNERIISINLPGLNKDAIKVEVKGKQLTIQALQKQAERIDKKGFHQESSSATNFLQVIPLPENAIAHKIRAEYMQEVLTITIPMAKEVRKPKAAVVKIDVK
ncbi:MAG: Hsp20/alpha crystallin family protein [Candidatus Omnitrophica bacterium]|nr:Hsp20/alpha crystallin family protein [Candidatus Omnitrophota bacterium]